MWLKLMGDEIIGTNKERLMMALLAWGVQRGAHTAYLQVMCSNEPALRLYERLGLVEKYWYWYRIKL